MAFDVDTSQQKHSVTTSDTKAELVAITMKPYECVCQCDVYCFQHALPTGVNLTRICTQ